MPGARPGRGTGSLALGGLAQPGSLAVWRGEQLILAISTTDLYIQMSEYDPCVAPI